MAHIFVSRASCIFYLLLHFQLDVHYMAETMHQIGHMCKLNPYKMLPTLLHSPQLVLNCSEENDYYFRLF